jgi:hypothetical protein
MGLVRDFPRYERVSACPGSGRERADESSWGGNDMDSNRIAKVDGTINDLGIEYLKL